MPLCIRITIEGDAPQFVAPTIFYSNALIHETRVISIHCLITAGARANPETLPPCPSGAKSCSGAGYYLRILEYTR